MADTEELILSRLSGYAGLIALIGSRIYPLTIPQECSLPALTYMVISDPPEHAMGNDADISTMRMQISCLADSYKSAKAVYAQVKAALSRYRAGTIKDIFLETPMDDFEPETSVFQIIVDFTIYHS